MSIESKLTSPQMYKLLCNKFPNINPVKNEDLSIHNAKMRIIKTCWYDLKTFPTVKKIADATGVSERNLYKFAEDNNLKQRKPRKNGKSVRLSAALQSL